MRIQMQEFIVGYWKIECGLPSYFTAWEKALEYLLPT
jgi:hypothetical protein